MLIAQDGMLIAERRDVSFFFKKKIPCFFNSSIVPEFTERETSLWKTIETTLRPALVSFSFFFGTQLFTGGFYLLLYF